MALAIGGVSFKRKSCIAGSARCGLQNRPIVSLNFAGCKKPLPVAVNLWQVRVVWNESAHDSGLLGTKQAKFSIEPVSRWASQRAKGENRGKPQGREKRSAHSACS